MRKIVLFNIVALCFITFMIGCDNNPESIVYQKEVMVYGFLWGNEPLDQSHAIQIAYSQPIDQPFSSFESAVAGVAVTLTEVESGTSVSLHETANRPGYYFNEQILIQPGSTYLLEIETGDQTVSAQTTVPSDLLIETALATDTVNNVYQDDLGTRMPLYLDLESQNDNRVILVEMYCEEPYDKAEYIYPFGDSHKYPEDQEEYDGGIDGEPRRIQAFAVYKDLLAADYENKPVIYWYESMMVFFGRYTMEVIAIDDNYHYYLTSEHAESNGGIEGGLGVFGSVVGKIYQLNVLKPAD